MSLDNALDDIAARKMAEGPLKVRAKHLIPILGILLYLHNAKQTENTLRGASPIEQDAAEQVKKWHLAQLGVYNIITIPATLLGAYTICDALK